MEGSWNWNGTILVCLKLIKDWLNFKFLQSVAYVKTAFILSREIDLPLFERY